jgi:hypothetical protein
MSGVIYPSHQEEIDAMQDIINDLVTELKQLRNKHETMRENWDSYL